MDDTGIISSKSGRLCRLSDILTHLINNRANRVLVCVCSVYLSFCLICLFACVSACLSICLPLQGRLKRGEGAQAPRVIEALQPSPHYQIRLDGPALCRSISYLSVYFYPSDRESGIIAESEISQSVC